MKIISTINFVINLLNNSQELSTLLHLQEHIHVAISNKLDTGSSVLESISVLLNSPKDCRVYIRQTAGGLYITQITYVAFQSWRQVVGHRREKFSPDNLLSLPYLFHVTVKSETGRSYNRQPVGSFEKSYRLSYRQDVWLFERSRTFHTK